MISSELPEILGMSDRILVMREGRVTGEFTRPKMLSQEAHHDRRHPASSGWKLWMRPALRLRSPVSSIWANRWPCTLANEESTDRLKAIPYLEEYTRCKKLPSRTERRARSKDGAVAPQEPSSASRSSSWSSSSSC